MDRRTILLGALASASCASAPTRDLAALTAPAPLPAVVDASFNIGRYARTLYDAGARAIFRYYALDYQPQLPTKRITPAERDQIYAAGLALGTVYQYRNNQLASMTTERGELDSASARAQAATIDQPQGSAIYFGVDADWTERDEVERVLRYFTAIDAGMRGSGFSVGVYGSGRICRELETRGLASKFWLANVGFTGVPQFYNSGRWHFLQANHEIARDSVALDTNIVNPARADIGLFNQRGLVATNLQSEASLRARRFVGQERVEVRAEANSTSRVLRTLRRRKVVNVISEANGWAGIDVAETGTIYGYCVSSALVSMDRMPE